MSTRLAEQARDQHAGSTPTQKTAQVERPDPRTRRPPRRLQTLWIAIAVLWSVPGIGATLLRVFPPEQDAGALAASFIPYGMIGYAFALIFFLLAWARARRRTALGLCSIVTAALLIIQAGWLVPLFVDDHRALSTAPITVLSLNTKAGEVDEAELAERAATVDVMVLVEVTPQLLSDLENGPVGSRFHYVVPDQETAVSVSAIFSRFPVVSAQALPRTSWQMYSARIAAPGIGQLNVVGAHPCNPLCGGDRWASEHAVLKSFVQALPSGPTIVAGDFNATDDHLPMRTLARAGFVSATDVAGAGWLPTFPSNSRIPPLIPIDHVLINSDLTATSVTSFGIGGSDHRGLLAVIGGSR